MAYGIYSIAGGQDIATTSTERKHVLGTVVEAVDPDIGDGQFIYLLGVASTIVGSVVKWNTTTFQTTLVTAIVQQNVPVGVAMSANVASQYGWYQIAGNAVIKKTAVSVAPNVSLYISGTAGRVKVLTSAGLQINACKSANLATVTATTSTITATIERPSLQGAIT